MNEQTVARPRLVDQGPVDTTPHKTFRIAVSGDVSLRRLEVDLVDTREFQRLRSIKQLGTAYLVYPSATHTRFEHSLGALFEASAMVNCIRDNPKSPTYQKEISPEDERLIRLAALLHDLPHIPFGHTLEEETGVIYPRHDEDVERRSRLVSESPVGTKLLEAIGKEQFDLLLRIMNAKPKEVPKLGDRAYIADIVNNTVCADLLDYLKRDVYFCGIRDSFGDRFLRYLYLDRVADGEHNPKRLIVRLWKKEDWRHRRDVLSELVDLLRARYSLGEKVYFHHAKMSSAAMISRAVWAAMHPNQGSPLSIEQLCAMGDDHLLAYLEESTDPTASYLANSLRSRALFKRVYSLTRAEAEAAPSENWVERMVDEYHDNPQNRANVEDQLADLAGLRPGEVLIYCPDLSMGKKYAHMLVEWKGEFKQLRDVDDQATRPALNAILKSHDLLWGLHVFVSPGAAGDSKTWDTLRYLCDWKFSSVGQPRDRERRLEAAMRLMINRRLGHEGTTDDAEKALELLLSKSRGGPDHLTTNGIQEAIEEARRQHIPKQ